MALTLLLSGVDGKEIGALIPSSSSSQSIGVDWAAIFLTIGITIGVMVFFAWVFLRQKYYTKAQLARVIGQLQQEEDGRKDQVFRSLLSKTLNVSQLKEALKIRGVRCGSADSKEVLIEALLAQNGIVSFTQLSAMLDYRVRARKQFGAAEVANSAAAYFWLEDAHELALQRGSGDTPST